MKTAPEPAQRWWYRLLKVLHIVIYVLIALLICTVAYEANKPYPKTSYVSVAEPSDYIAERKSLDEIFGTQSRDIRKDLEAYRASKKTVEVVEPVTDEQKEEAVHELLNDLIVPMISLFVISYLLNRAFKYIFLKETFLGDPDVKAIVIATLAIFITVIYASNTYGV
jgi:hypothetical protein